MGLFNEFLQNACSHLALGMMPGEAHWPIGKQARWTLHYTANKTTDDKQLAGDLDMQLLGLRSVRKPMAL